MRGVGRAAAGLATNEQVAKQVSSAMVMLADYQENVGPRPITMLPALPSDPAATDPAQLARQIVEHSKNSTYQTVQPLVEADQKRLKRLVDRAFEVRRKRKSG